MGRPKGGTNKKHSKEEKLVIVMRYLNYHESIKEIEKKTGISN
jgi:transposase-like protein